MLVKPQAVGYAIRMLTPSCFYKPERQVIFQSIIDLWNQGVAIDLVTVTNSLRNNPKYTEYEKELVECSVYNVGYHYDHYSKIIRDLYLLRKIRMRLEKGLGDMSEIQSWDVGELLGNLTDDLLTYKQQSEHFNNCLTPIELTDTTLMDIDKRYEAFIQGIAIGVPTGYAEIDKKTCGLQPGDFVIIAGRPSMGKSDWMINIMVNAAHAGYKGLIISLEMNAIPIWKRVFALHTNLYRGRFRNGDLKEGHMVAIHQKSNLLRELPLTIMDKAQKQMRFRDIRSMALEQKHKANLDVLAIDYIGLITPSKSFSREREVAQISAGLKMLGHELQIPIIAVSQLSRGLEMRDNRRPRMSDLRDSGALEQDADIIFLLYRSSYYNEQDKQEEKIDPRNDSIDIDMAKNRDGETLSISEKYNRAIGRIGGSEVTPPEPDDREPAPVVKESEEPF
jgi:replicative DNA helicase